MPDKLNDEPGYVRLPVEEGGRDLPDAAVFAPGRDRLALMTPRMRSLGEFPGGGLCRADVTPFVHPGVTGIRG